MESKYGGTWERYGQGKTLVGLNESETEFSTINKIGGEKTHTLTINEMPSHNHVVQFAFAGNSETGSVVTVPGYPVLNKSGQYEVGTVSNTGGNTGHTHSISSSSASTGTVGSSKAININNVQPYITVYMYKRTK